MCRECAVGLMALGEPTELGDAATRQHKITYRKLTR
jgi:hypothetical protein